ACPRANSARPAPAYRGYPTPCNPTAEGKWTAMPAPRIAPLAALLSAAAGAQSVATRPAAYTATAPLSAAIQSPAGGRRRAELAILSGATTITIGNARLHGDLLRVSAPAGG